MDDPRAIIPTIAMGYPWFVLVIINFVFPLAPNLTMKQGQKPHCDIVGDGAFFFSNLKF